MCDVLHVSETGYYRFKRNLGNPSKDAVLSAVIQEILDEYIYNDNYGVDRMQIALRNLGYKVGKRRIARIMKENGWLHERKRRPKGLTRATTEIQEKENLIKQDFRSDRPYQKLLTDISVIYTFVCVFSVGKDVMGYGVTVFFVFSGSFIYGCF